MTHKKRPPGMVADQSSGDAYWKRRCDLSHLFVTRGDLGHLACDAWLLPTDVACTVEPSWLASLSEDEQVLLGRLQPTNPLSRNRVRQLDATGGTSRAWLTDVGGSLSTPAGWYVNGVDAFLMQVEEWLAANPATVNGRERPLVGLPVVGTGAGGGQLTKGSIVDQLVKYLAARAAAAPFDVVLVVRGSRMHAAVEYSRRAATATRSVTSALSPELEAAAKELARRANKGELVLFLGAGVSMGAGLPGWNGLLGSLAESAGLQAAESESLSRMSHLDQAHLISRRLEQLGKDLGTSVKEQLAASNYSLSHSLLASLPVREVATTNYDQLFECASSDAGTPAAVLPYAANRNRERWLLKLHGCVTQPQDIVLTRSDYLRYAERRAALAGIVQALLITKHMLFVGFSLTDENFHRIADDVRRAMSGQGQSDLRCGTAMVLSPDPLMAELWLPEIACTPVSEGGGATRAAARELEIFLDRVLAECTDMTSHILDDTFEHLLSPGELELRSALRAMEYALGGDARSTGAFSRVEQLLVDLGLGKDSERGGTGETQ